MSDLIDTTEMYLRTIYELEEEGITPLRARIAERLDQSGPTVSQTVARMERNGLLTVEGDRHLQLTSEGRLAAQAVMRRHRLAECLLADWLELPLALVHEEACRWEHAISEEVADRIALKLGNPQVSPFGNAIPGSGSATAGFIRLTDKFASPASEDGLEVKLVQIAETLQADADAMAGLVAAGILPGCRFSVRRTGGGFDLKTADGPGLLLAADQALHLYIAG